MFVEKTKKFSKKMYPSAPSPTMNLTCNGLGSNPGHRDGKPATR